MYAYFNFSKWCGKLYKNGVADDTNMGWQKIQKRGGKRYKREVANDTKYGVAAEIQPVRDRG